MKANSKEFVEKDAEVYAKVNLVPYSVSVVYARMNEIAR